MNYKPIFIILFISLFLNICYAQTDVSGSVSGSWTSSGDPYNVTGNLTVDVANTLTIDPGVHVYFQGDYTFEISGTLNADGTVLDSILFTIGGIATEFGGIRFLSGSAGSISYARIEHGTANGTSPLNRGGAIYCEGATPTFAHLVLNNNSSSNIGGGICLYNSDADITDCIIENNSANYAGGVYVRGAGNILRNKISNNSASILGGGMNLVGTSSPTLANNSIYNNTCTDGSNGGGGVAFLSGNTALFINNVIYNNTATNNGGGIYLDNSGTNITCSNNILWANTASGSGTQVYTITGTTIDIDYCDVENGVSGTAGAGTINYGANNISSNPSFIEAANYDFHLSEASPCIDVGTSTGALGADADSNGTNQDGDNSSSNEYDIGAFEFLQEVNSFTDNTTTSYLLNTFEGNSTTVATITLNGTVSGSGDITVNCFTKSTPLNAPDGSKSIRRWYRISENGTLSYTDVDLRLFFNDIENLDNLTTSSLHLWHRSGSSWIDISGTVTTGSNYVQLAGVSQADLSGDWAFSDPSDAPLPVSLFSFSAASEIGQIKLKWSTASEINNLGFIVYRSDQKDGAYKKIASYSNDFSLSGGGSTSEDRNYIYSDYNIVSGKTYWYKLADMNYNGDIVYHQPMSATAMVTNINRLDPNLPKSWSLSQNYPNPFNPSTKINFDIPDDSDNNLNIQINIYDITGKIVRTLYKGMISPGHYQIEWDGRNSFGSYAGSGMYFYQFLSKDFHLTKRMLLVR